MQQALERVLFIRATRAAASSYVQARSPPICPAALLPGPGGRCFLERKAERCRVRSVPTTCCARPPRAQGMNDLVIPFLVVFFGEAADGATDIVRAGRRTRPTAAPVALCGHAARVPGASRAAAPSHR